MDDESRLPALSAGRPPFKAESRPLASVPDDVLLGRLAEILGQSRRVEADLIAHIAEVDERRLYAREAFPCRVGPGGRPPGPPTDPDVRVAASGSSGHGFAAQGRSR